MIDSRRHQLLRIWSRAISGLLIGFGVYFAFAYWGRYAAWQIATASIVSISASAAIVIAAVYRMTRDQPTEERGRTRLDLVADLATDTCIAAFLSVSVSVLVACVVRIEEEQQAVTGDLISLQEPIKEILYASTVGLVAFAALIMLRAALSAQNMTETAAILREAKEITQVSRQLHDRTLRLAAEAGAGTALASLLGQLPSLDGGKAKDRHAENDSERIQVITEAGSCAGHWLRYAASNELAPAAKLIRLAEGRAFLREASSDIARKERLAVSNIRYVTSIVCSTIMDLERHCIREHDGLWKPVWLGLTTYPAGLWFEDPKVLEESFLEETGLPECTMHAQYWGRYLRTLRYLLRPQGSVVCVRVHRGPEENSTQFDEHQSKLKIPVSESLHIGPPDNARVTYRIEKGGHHSPDVSRKFAAALVLDAAASICDKEALAEDHSGQIGLWLKEACEYSSPDQAEAFLERWYEEYASDISGTIRSCWDSILVWELWYLSKWPATPRVDTRNLAKASLANLTYVDGNPLEVFLDALLIYCEARETAPKSPRTVSQALLERWHHAPGSAAYRFCEGAAKEDALTDDKIKGLLYAMPDHGDIHAFGIVPISGNGTGVDWRRARWFSAMKSSMASALGVARVDFLDITNERSLRVKEVLGERRLARMGSDEVIDLSDFVVGLQDWNGPMGENLAKIAMT